MEAVAVNLQLTLWNRAPAREDFCLRLSYMQQRVSPGLFVGSFARRQEQLPKYEQSDQRD